jgi:5'-3' exonuclease
MSTFLIIDTNHLINRARHSVHGDISVQTGMALHIIFFSIKKLWHENAADHIVFTFDSAASKSWRREVFPEYKLHRTVMKESRTVDEVEDDKVFWAAMNDFQQFLGDKTNCTVLCRERFEADDLIARFIALHPEDNHIIVSSDNDFVQLVNDKVTIYNGITETFIRPDGIFNARGKPVFFIFKNDGKISIPKKLPENSTIPTLPPDWIEQSLFCKILRGDVGDGIFSAAKPGTRQTKLDEAYQDSAKRGYIFNNFMQQEWEDHNGTKQSVQDRFKFNKMLIDLKGQPDDIKEAIDTYIAETIANSTSHSQVGIWLMKFFAKYELNRLTDSVKSISECFSTRYPGV